MVDREQRRAGESPGAGSRLGAADRGQTLHDYTVGISLFIITVSTVLVGLFGFVGPLSTGVGSEEVSQSERISTALVQNLSTGRQPNELRADLLETALSRSETQLRTRWGLERSTQFNVTFTTLNGSRIVTDGGGTKLAAGSNYGGNAAGSTARIVQFDDGTCRPACRLTVRTW
ncbi:DUF7287 family protein [Halosimplex pelagicum]|uniref:Uncharacterized protein n=1 Tax=Halosimplex pelagicum TaxID=869886 RepID=A0A7D5T7Z2_9EURY|nr:hypothetical protein [Halosimplex pelagicum]QLH80610.1 hypothetical protein HZS54_02725 [Halosimplex pelagicum]